MAEKIERIVIDKHNERLWLVVTDAHQVTVAGAVTIEGDPVNTHTYRTTTAKRHFAASERGPYGLPYLIEKQTKLGVAFFYLPERKN